jgi:hypothetical protein
VPPTPATDQKLGEARYHLGCLAAAADVAIQRHHLSAFLAAGRSVTFALQKEAKAEYDRWFPSWLGALAPNDRDLLDYMRDQRNAELKQAGAAVSEGLEERSVWQRKSAGPNTPIVAQLLAFGLYGEDVTIAVPTLMFDMQGGQKPARDLCARYVALLESLVTDFKRAFP